MYSPYSGKILLAWGVASTFEMWSKVALLEVGHIQVRRYQVEMRKIYYLTALIRPSFCKTFSCLVFFLVHFLVFLEKMLQLCCSRSQKSALNWAHKKIADRKSISSQRDIVVYGLCFRTAKPVRYFIFLNTPGKLSLASQTLCQGPPGSGSAQVEVFDYNVLV